MKQIAALLLMLVSVVAYGQLAEEITFSEKQYDFGIVKEEAGPIIHEFKFINNSDKPIKILNVKASCGCTTPAWTREAVEPGASGFVQAQYNPKNRPGQFNKSLTISTDYSDQPIRLYIKGNVIPKPKTIEEELPTDIGGLRVKYRSFNIGKVLTTEEPTVKSFEIYNSSDSVITFADKIDGPDHISLEFEPKSLAPQAKGEVKVIFNGAKYNDLGFTNQAVTFYTDQPNDQSAKQITIFATVLEYFPPMSSEKLAKAPKMQVEELSHDFGKINGEDVVSASFVLSNVGETELNIRKTEANCDCTKASLKKDEIKAGKSVEMEVTFDPKGRRGNQQKSVTIYSNDPRNPVQRITIKAYIEK